MHLTSPGLQQDSELLLIFLFPLLALTHHVFCWPGPMFPKAPVWAFLSEKEAATQNGSPVQTLILVPWLRPCLFSKHLWLKPPAGDCGTPADRAAQRTV